VAGKRREATTTWGDAPVYAGLDLSSTADLTAFVPIAHIDDAWETKPTFWLPDSGLVEKSRADRVPYDLWHSQGFLETTPGKSVEYEFVAHWLFDFCQSHNVQKIAFDRWGMKYLKPWLLSAGFTEERISETFVEFGQGFQSMSPALRDLESALLSEKVRHGNHPVLTMCAANAVVTTDPAGGRKLNKAKAAGRIDGMVALTMAFGIAPLEGEVPVDIYAMVA
jgi:phage terminase large subunit-like protein